MRAGISLNFDRFSILTRVLEIFFLTLFCLFSLFYIYVYVYVSFKIAVSVENFQAVCLEIPVGGPSVLDFVWKRLSRSLLTAFLF